MGGGGEEAKGKRMKGAGESKKKKGNEKDKQGGQETAGQDRRKR